MHDELEQLPERSWRHKFRDAYRGIKLGVRGQSSFFVHFFLATAVIVVAVVLEVSLIEWCVLLICISGVLASEMFNSALESFAKIATREDNPNVGEALDIGSGAVLIASVGAAIIGVIILVNRLAILVGW